MDRAMGQTPAPWTRAPRFASGTRSEANARPRDRSTSARRWPQTKNSSLLDNSLRKPDSVRDKVAVSLTVCPINPGLPSMRAIDIEKATSETVAKPETAHV